MNDYKNHSEVSEQAVIGALLLNPKSFIDINEIITEEDFFNYKNKIIFSAIVSVDKKRIPIDVPAIIQHLSNQKKIEDAGGLAYLAELATSQLETRNIIYYARMMKEKSNERLVVDTARAMITEIIEGDGESEERINNALAMPMAIESKEAEQLDIGQILRIAVKELEERHNTKGKIIGLRTQYKAIDERINGLLGGMLWVIGARPAMGKSSWALNLSNNFAFNGEHGSTMFFSLEMTSQELMGKMICAVGKVDYRNYRTGNIADEEWTKVSHAITKLKTADIVIDDRPGLTLQQIRAKCIRQKRKTGNIKAVFVDYLTLIHTPNKNSRTEEIGLIAQGLKELAKEIKCPVIALAQLSRKVEERGDRRPMMSDLRDSGCIEQAADVISFIYRDEVYNENSQHVGIAEIITAKNRAGEVGKDFLRAELKYSRFDNLDFVPNIQPQTKKSF